MPALCLMLSGTSVLCPKLCLHNRRKPTDGEYKWILHATDHWMKFNFAFPLQSKEAESVSEIF